MTKKLIEELMNTDESRDSEALESLAVEEVNAELFGWLPAA